MILAAGFVVSRISLIFSKNLDIVTARNNSPQVEYDESDDYDHDGLSNTEEAYWNTDPFSPDTDGDGFLDGEEVLSQRDPKQSALAMNDSLDEKSRIMTANLTTGVSNLIVAGLAAGDLKRTADPKTFNDAVDKISLAAIYDALDALENITLKEENFNIVESTLENQHNYVNKISNLIDKNLSSIIINQPQEINRFFIETSDVLDNPNQTRIKNAFLEHASKFEEAYQALSEYPVPKNWIEIHKASLLLLKKIEMHHRSIALSNDDPFKMMIVLANLQTIYVEAQSLLNKISGQIKSNNLISSNNDLFNLIDALKN